MGLVSFDFTHVMYDDSDPIAFVMAFFSIVPQSLLLCYVTLFFSRREVETALMLAGQLGTELVSKYLKNLIKQERPESPGIPHVTYGMPSSHAQFMTYYATYLCLWMCFRMRYQFSFQRKLSRGLAVYVLAGLVCYSRYYLHYHTLEQIGVGVMVGIILAVGWFITVVFLRELGIIDLLLDLYPARYFYVKDTACDRPSFIKDEYYEWRRVRNKMKLLVKAD